MPMDSTSNVTTTPTMNDSPKLLEFSEEPVFSDCLRFTGWSSGGSGVIIFSIVLFTNVSVGCVGVGLGVSCFDAGT